MSARNFRLRYRAGVELHILRSRLLGFLWSVSVIAEAVQAEQPIGVTLHWERLGSSIILCEGLTRRTRRVR